jgi:hypothetical protein
MGNQHQPNNTIYIVILYGSIIKKDKRGDGKLPEKVRDIATGWHIYRY